LLMILTVSSASAEDARLPKVLLFGDSIVAGYGLGEQEVLSGKLEASLMKHGVKVTVVNGGVSGDTTAAGRSRLAWTLKQYEPDVVVLALGGNDMLRGLPPATTRSNVDAMLAELISKPGRRVILSAVLAPDNLGAAYRDDFNRIYPELAKKYDVKLYPFLLENVYGKAGMMQADGVHPTAQGVQAIADGLSAFLRTHYLKPAV
jgi:acyl-CoA thioesterase I